MVEKLESPEYGFKCCFADRNFDLGVHVFENITRCIHSSKKTVIVLTPEYLESPWCSYETRITLECDLDTKQRLLIPVMLRRCQIPNFIGKLTYMEVENEHFWERLVDALKRDDEYVIDVNEMIGSPAIMACRPFQYNPNFFNGEDIAEETVYIGTNCCAEEQNDYMPPELMRHGLQLTVEEYKDIVRVIKKICYVKCRGCFSKAFFYIAAFIAFMISVGFQFSFYITPAYQSPEGIVFIIAVFNIPFILCFFIIRLIIILTAIRTLSRGTEEAQKIASTRNILISVKDYGCCNCACDRTTIIFKYYDWGPCLSRLKLFLLNREKQRTHNEGECSLGNPEEGNLPSNAADEQECSLIDVAEDNLPSDAPAVEEEALKLLLQHATEYGEFLVNKYTVSPAEQRHTRQGECLCQFVESILEANKTSCLDRCLGVRRRHPWKRLLQF